ncbi:hypothetical protein GWI33_014755 [Rhynchophorus ferrugineus]|uniref:Uncharacterized protein n=1 Tax=Rhynchophorus ferrugineus TaxID=354439 RepID=A0A834M570_RHYFE|nr:hypothetical protein GWI33_014755 [Rhynchophorus ferrugineus]
MLKLQVVLVVAIVVAAVLSSDRHRFSAVKTHFGPVGVRSSYRIDILHKFASKAYRDLDVRAGVVTVSYDDQENIIRKPDLTTFLSSTPVVVTPVTDILKHNENVIIKPVTALLY